MEFDKTKFLVKDTNDYVEFDVDDKLIQEAYARNKSFFSKYGHAGTHRKNVEKQRMTGYLAEVAIKKTFDCLEYSNSDVVDFLYKSKSFDSKSQGCNTVPLPHYVGTLYEEQDKRNADFYIFSRVKNDFSKVWIIGFISKKDFLTKSTLMPAGTVNNNFTYDNARYELEYNNLYKPKILFIGCKN